MVIAGVTYSPTSMDLVVGILVGIAVIAAAWGFIRTRRSRRTPEAIGMQSALHAATSTLPHLRRGLSPRTAQEAVPQLRVVQEAASLVSAQVELSVVAEQEERLAQAELRALRAQISPHFIYNALAAVAGDIHERPEEARELLTDFAEFTRYLFRDGRSYVTLGEELAHVERYLRLEQARFGGLQVTIDVPEEAREAVVPAMSVQPLVENAVRHGIERRAGSGKVAIICRVRGGDVELRVSDDGAGIEPERVPVVLAGAGGGIGVSNVDARLRATFGERYALRIESKVGEGTTAVMTVPNLRGEREELEFAQAAEE